MEGKKLVTWFVNEVVPGLVAKGCFGGDYVKGQVLVESCRFENFERGVVNFASCPSFLELVLKSPEGTSFVFHLFVKFQVQDSSFREKMRTVVQFRNESNFYNEVVSEFRKFLGATSSSSSSEREFSRILQDLIPKCYYAQQPVDEPEKGLLVFEDLRKSGFEMPRTKVEMNEDHCKLAVEYLARFHAISFAMKLVKWPGFEKLKKVSRKVWLSEDRATREHCRDFKGYCARRGINYLLREEESPVPKSYLEKLTRKLENLFDLLAEANSPEEPLSVVCHGDFNANNLMFAYDGTARPIRAKLIDFQTFLYGSPCLDLSFFIYMNTTLRLRERHFQDIFQLYYSTLVTTTSLMAGVKEDVVSSWIPFGAFLRDFERTSMNAYVTVSYFLPVMMAPTEEEIFESMKRSSDKEMAEKTYRQGGETVSKRIAEVIVDFFQRRFFIESSEN